jgi:hypothetical protein
MDYRDILGLPKKQPKKKVEKRVAPKPTTPPVTELLKKEFGPLNEWSEVDAGPKRWSKPMNSGLTEFEKSQMNEGPAYEYAKFVKKIDKQRDQVGKDTLKFVDLLRKKGLDDAADELLDSYKDNVITFGKDLKQIVRKLM